ncbi:probable Na(+)/H(+) antiporter nhx-9 isoform X1 [Daphnia pulicaria]|uniref:probable Na(+)/H(+) antiporter nhx-9 isoform X1 n=1 Tax=Daphnia pulicaria TaxID=35523 RepID=UPI001EEB8B61|nr:probable Na(+)/H(+) antiporter nhx-9 isoform X1 [Daphnia pulicaria]XP_046633401.1 probable Na(+)/H(+) antiporter nhx-9 isoform X1 [Daphnia pulicaria]
MNCLALLSLFCVLSVCNSFPQQFNPTTETLSANVLQLGETKQLIHSNTVGSNQNLLQHGSPTQTNSTLHHIPIAEPNFPRVAVPFAIGMWVLGVCIVKTVVNGWPKLLAWFPETCCLVVVGFAVGGVLYATKTAVLSPLSSTIFFFCMLPPIILDAGYFMPNRLFFDHFGTILLFAVAGTIFNAICIGISLWACGLSGIYGFEISLLETLLFSSLISAVDPVTVLAVLEEVNVAKVLYIIVFGESLMNDAVSVVLYNMCDSYVTLGADKIETADVLTGFAAFIVLALGGTIIGIVWGFLAGFVTKFTHRVPVIEPIFVFIMSYGALINAEAFQLSGIFSVMFCGITMKNYMAENVSPASLTTINKGLKAISNCSESIIFMFLGITTVNDHHEWNTAFILLTVFFCTLYRAIGVFLLSEIANYFRLHKLNFVEKLVMSYSGLRGAIAFALVLLIDPGRIPRQPLFVTATITVVFFTVFFQGITIRPLVRFLKVKQEEHREKTMNERLHDRMLDYMMAGVHDVLGRCNSVKVRNKFKQWDYAYIRPFFIRGKKHREPKITETYWALTVLEATELARCNTRARLTEPCNENTTTNIPQPNENQVVEFYEYNEDLTTTEDSWTNRTCHHSCKLYRCKSVGHSRCFRYALGSQSVDQSRNVIANQVAISECQVGNKKRVERTITFRETSDRRDIDEAAGCDFNVFYRATGNSVEETGNGEILFCSPVLNPQGDTLRSSSKGSTLTCGDYSSLRDCIESPK